MVKKKKKSGAFFKIMRVLVLFVMGLVVAVLIALSQINLESLRGSVLTVLREATGLPVEIDGVVSWKLSLRPQIELNGVRVPNADWAHHKDAFNAERVDVTLDLVSLFRDRPTIQSITIHDANVFIEKNTDGDFSVMPVIKSDNKTDDAVQKADNTPDEFPFVATGLGSLEIKNLNAQILDNVYSVDGFRIRYIPHTDTREYSGWIRNDNSVFPFILVFSQYNAERKVYPMRIAFATGGEALIANVALEGTSKAPIDFIIKGDIPDVTLLGDVFNLNVEPMPTISVNIAGGFDWQKLTLRNSSFTVRGNTVDFSGVVDWSGAVPKLTATIESEWVDLTELFPSAYDGGWVRPNRELNVFHDIPLYGAEFLKFNADVHFMLDNFVVYRELNLRDMDVRVDLENGRARVDAKTVIADGNVQAAANVNIEPDGRMYVRMGGVGRNIVIGNLLHQINIDNLISELPVSFDMYVEATGSTMSEWMQTITGPVQIYSSGVGYAHSALVSNVYGTDFLTTLRHSITDLFSSQKKYNQINISCVSVNTKLREGHIETSNGVALETNAINVRLAGDLDLGDETIHLALTTVPVRGLKLSLTGNVVNSIEITDNLAEPTVRISGAAVAGKVASATGLGLLLAPFTGGIGLVAGAGVGLLAGDLLENWLADDNPCETAMTRGAPLQRGDVAWMGVPVADLVNSILNNTPIPQTGD